MDRAEYHVHRLDTLQVTEAWPAISAALTESMPPDEEPSPDMLGNAFQELMADTMQAWVITVRRDGKSRVAALATTRWIHSGLSKSRYLGISSLYSYERVPDEVLRTALDRIKRYAKGGGATKVIAYSSGDRVVQMAEATGADASWRVLTWEVES